MGESTLAVVVEGRDSGKDCNHMKELSIGKVLGKGCRDIPWRIVVAPVGEGFVVAGL